LLATRADDEWLLGKGTVWTLTLEPGGNIADVEHQVPVVGSLPRARAGRGAAPARPVGGGCQGWVAAGFGVVVWPVMEPMAELMASPTLTTELFQRPPAATL
jgi:type IV secretory pathway TrbD component